MARTKTGFTASGAFLLNKMSKNGASMASEAREKIMDNRLKTTYDIIFPF